MKKVLILAYDFPPYVSVGGLRPYNWLKYFRAYGVDPVVVTRQWSLKYGNELDYIAPGASGNAIIEENDHGTVIRTPYKPNLSNRLLLKYGPSRFVVIRKAVSAWYNLTQFIFKTGPKSGLYHGAREYLRTHRVDAIIATAEPYVLFSYAAALSREFDIPWIADYRDPWSQNEERQKTWLHKFCSTVLEKRIMKNVSAVVTVSDMLRHLIGTLVKDKPFYILPNGYDPDAIAAVSHIPQQSEQLRIAMVGTIYKWHPIRSFLNVLAEYSKDHPESRIMLSFYGVNIESQIRKMISEDFPVLKDRVEIHAKMPNAALMERIASDNVMLLFNYYSHMGTKIFDYVGLQRKIILCYSNDPEGEALKKQHFNVSKDYPVSHRLQEDLMNETRSGIAVRDAAHLYEVFTQLQAEFNARGYIECNSVNTENYSRKIQVAKLADIVRSI